MPLNKKALKTGWLKLLWNTDGKIIWLTGNQCGCDDMKEASTKGSFFASKDGSWITAVLQTSAQKESFSK